MTIVEFFDPKNVEHIKAYHHLCETGVWPLAFWEELNAKKIEVPTSWQFAVVSKLAERYVNEALGIHAPPKMRPYLTVDAVIRRSINGVEHVLLIDRARKPLGKAFPGGHVNHGETVEEAVRREIKEETNLDLVNLRQFAVYSARDRDPRGHTISVVFLAGAHGDPTAGDDAAGAKWVPWLDAMESSFAFDHKQILIDVDTYERLGKRPL